MITIGATINIVSSDDGKLNDATITLNGQNVGGNNVSADIKDVLNKRSIGGNPFLLGVSGLNGGATYSKKPLDFFVGNILSSTPTQSGELPSFPEKYILTLIGEKIKVFTIVFDEVNETYPRSLLIDGKFVSNENTSAIITVDEADTHTIEFLDLNKPNRPLIIQGVFIDLKYEINNRNLQSLEAYRRDRGDYSKPSYGVISSYGQLDFKDYDGKIKDYYEQLLLKSGLSVDLVVRNTLVKTDGNGNPIQWKKHRYYTDKWSYGNNSNLVSVSLKDDLEEWQNINITGLEKSIKKDYSISFKEVYEYLYSCTPSKYRLQSFNELDEKTKDILENSYISYLKEATQLDEQKEITHNVLENGTLWDSFSKLCIACSLHIYKENEITVCRYNGGN